MLEKNSISRISGEEALKHKYFDELIKLNEGEENTELKDDSFDSQLTLYH
jgi:hypothetical protein